MPRLFERIWSVFTPEELAATLERTEEIQRAGGETTANGSPRVLFALCVIASQPLLPDVPDEKRNTSGTPSLYLLCSLAHASPAREKTAQTIFVVLAIHLP